jgi:hypothetical protein
VDIATWPRGLGLEAYEPAFRDNRVDAEIDAVDRSLVLTACAGLPHH